MAFYEDEEEVWKCQLHPSRRRTIGVCPYCLRERLSSLCPECANVRPCGCCCSSSSSSSSSVASVFYSAADNTGNFLNPAGSAVGKVSNLIENEPSFRRSRSAAFFPFFKSARYSSAAAKELTDRKDLDGGDSVVSEASGLRNSKNSRSFWLLLWPLRSRKEKPASDEEEVEDVRDMRRSRSVAAVFTRRGGGGRREEMRSSGKSKGWYYFPSPMKAFRHSSSKASAKIVQDHSPLHRG